MRPVHGLFTTVLILLILTLGASPGGAAPEGQLTWAVHFSLAPTLFEPAETPGLITPFMILYALHDANGGGETFNDRLRSTSRGS